MTTDKNWVRILIYNDCGTEKFLNVFIPVSYAWVMDPPIHASGDMCLSEYRWGSVMNIANWSSGFHYDPIFNTF